MRLKELQDKIRELLYLEDSNLVNLILAVALSREQKVAKLWLIIIGKSGDGKSELLRVLDDGGVKTKLIRQLTSRTLVNGRKDKTKFPDLAPKLKDKIMLMPEMACVLTAPPEEKANIWAQLRDLYDEIAGKQSGDGLDIDYTNLNVTFIGCSTPAIDKQVLIHQSLGTREMLYRCDEKDEEELMNKVVKNTTIDKDVKRQELKTEVQRFLNEREYKNLEIGEEIERKIKKWAQVVANLRVSGDIDYSTGELMNPLYPEQPTRILQQLLTLFRALKSLDEDYSDSEAMEVIKKVVVSSCDPTRFRILRFLMENAISKEEGYSKRELANEEKISTKKVFIEANILYHLGLVKRNNILVDYDRDLFNFKFKINSDNPIVQHLAKEFGIEIKLNVEEVKIR
jgi:hypothetical protein